MFPKDVRALIPRTWEYVTLRGKRDFADVTKGADLEMKRLYWTKPSEPNPITHILDIGELFPAAVTEKDVRAEKGQTHGNCRL